MRRGCRATFARRTRSLDLPRNLRQRFDRRAAERHRVDDRIIASNRGATLAFGLAVINRQAEAAKVALDVGADIDAFLPVHAHMTALHQAAVHDDVDLLDMLVARGATQDVRDTLWDATPLDMARDLQKPTARAALERHATAR